MNTASKNFVTVAKIITQVTNPVILSILTIVLIALTESPDVTTAVQWLSVIFLFLVIIPWLYVYFRTSDKTKKIYSLDRITGYLRQNPKEILILSILVGLPVVLILFVFKAPVSLISCFVSLLIGSLFAGIFNLFYGVSYHVTAVTILLIVVVTTWGHMYMLFAVIIPLVAWAKYKIRAHSLIRLIIGALLGTSVGITITYLFHLW